MIGDVQDFVRRMRSVLPRGWFADVSPISDIVLGAQGAAWQYVFGLISTVRNLARIRTSSSEFLDLISVDFFGYRLPRRDSERDDAFVDRIESELLRARATRPALATTLFQLTGHPPIIIEPARPMDTGAYTIGGSSYGVAGAWGSLAIGHCCFVTAFRPHGQGIAAVAGFGTGGPFIYASQSMVAALVSDADIFAAAASVLPLGCTAWLRISD